jgi:hypothetical protein
MSKITDKGGFTFELPELEMVNRQTQEIRRVGVEPPPEGLPFGIIDPDYARIFTQARIIAWQYGYACVMHGSFTRDLDLLLVPREERAFSNHEQILKLIAQACGLRFSDGVEDILKAKVDLTDKPHGRKACSLYFPGSADRRWVDLSFTPCAAKDEAMKSSVKKGERATQAVTAFVGALDGLGIGRKSRKGAA